MIDITKGLDGGKTPVIMDSSPLQRFNPRQIALLSRVAKEERGHIRAMAARAMIGEVEAAVEGLDLDRENLPDQAPWGFKCVSVKVTRSWMAGLAGNCFHRETEREAIDALWQSVKIYL